MPRLLFILILFVVSFLVVRSIRNKLDKNKRINDDKAQNNAQNKAQNNKTKMLKCDECGLHIPEHEAIKQGNHAFCSLEHARQRLE